MVEQVNQLAVITPHQLLHGLRQEGALVQGLEPNADEQPQVNRQFFQHDGRTLKTQMAFSNEGWWLIAKMGRGEGGAHQNQHVWDGDNIRLIPHRHGGLKVVASVLPVRHSAVGMKCDVVFLDAFSGKHFERKNTFMFLSLLYVCQWDSF